MGLIASAPQLAGWTPVDVSWPPDPVVVRWRYTEGIEFTEPFFTETVDRVVSEPFRLLFSRTTPVGALSTFARSHPGLPLAGIVFHVSRAGSTLVGQMLAALGDTLVLSEPPALDRLLRAPPGVWESDAGSVADRLSWMVSALGQPRRPEHVRAVVKLDAWALLRWRDIVAAFPGTPCVLLYRDPVEVLASHLARRGYHMIPGTLSPQELDRSAAFLGSLSPEEYGAVVLGTLAAAAVDAVRAGALHPVHYGELPSAVPDLVAPLFGVDVGPGERQVFDRVAAVDAKNPFVPFSPDSETKQLRASAAVRRAVREHAGAPYEALQELQSVRR